MSVLGLIYVWLAHYITGRGILHLMRLKLPRIDTICLSLMIGVPTLSFVPCVIQLGGYVISDSNIAIGIAVLTGLLAIPLLIKMKRPRVGKISLPASYELPFIAIFLLHIGHSIWRCYYYPPFARDMLTGPEVVAEYAVREGNMINSVFSLAMQNSNNFFKSPYITGLQIIYKLLVCPFGQLWLSALAIPFMIWLYVLLRRRIHPLVAGVVFMIFLMMPEVYAYTYLILYDYSNMVFFFLGYYFMLYYFREREGRYFFFAALMFGLATFIRTETVILVCMTAPVVALYMLKKKLPLIKTASYLAIFIAVPVIFYFVCIDVFVRNFVPLPFDVAGQVNHNLADVSPFFLRFKEMSTVLIFSNNGYVLFGFFVYFFVALLLADIIFVRRFNTEAKVALYGVVVVYTGLCLIGYLLPLADLVNTSKRGLFKMMPLALLYIANSGLLLRLSERIREWESGKEGKAVNEANEVIS